MLIYLFTLVSNGKARYGDAIPAGVLYMPAKASAFTAERGKDLSKQGNPNDKKMQGFVLENADVIVAMEQDGARKSARNANIGTSARMKIIFLQENWTITENSERGMKNGSQVDD